MKAVRPKFDRPPLIEQAITVVFDELAGFSIGDFGRFWARVEDEFPDCAQAAPLPTATEQLGGIPVQHEVHLVFAGAESMPRCLLRHPSSGEALQIQTNRFTFNWAKIGNAPYPHSEQTVARFERLFRIFEEYVASRNLGPINILQCEITNVNIVPESDFGQSFADAPRAFHVPAYAPESDILRLENYMGTIQYLIVLHDDPQGRLHVALSPVLSNRDRTRAYKLELTARSGRAIEGTGFDNVLSFFDAARTAINAAFLAHTNPEMWVKWGRRDG